MGTMRLQFKMAAADKNPILQQANTLWKMLDDLAETDPERYSTFMDSFLKQNKDWCKPPEPVFCLRTQKLPAESSNHHFFINICKWDQVPPSKQEGELKLSVFSSGIRNVPASSGKHSVVDICFHTNIMNEMGTVNEYRKAIASIALDYVEKQTTAKLSREYKILAIKYKGDEKLLNKFLLRIIKPQDINAGNRESSAGNIKVGKNGSPAVNKPLIEELSPAAAKATQVPKHSVDVVKETGGSPRCIVVKVDLPKACSGSECELDLSKDDLLLSHALYSKLHLQLREQGNEDEAMATFNKTTHQLTVTIPVQL